MSKLLPFADLYGGQEAISATILHKLCGSLAFVTISNNKVRETCRKLSEKLHYCETAVFTNLFNFSDQFEPSANSGLGLVGCLTNGVAASRGMLCGCEVQRSWLLSRVARGSSLIGCCANGMTSVPGGGTVAVFGIGACRCPYGHRSSPIG
ncbi:hypothetical protein TNCV_2417781 [Trichonephila clavipes]|nr:hypothetical protein TNCV_2417781 [Trichonephila clavipes]